MKTNNIQQDIIKHHFKITQKERIILNQQTPKLLWFTGLSGSGKSAIANEVEIYLHESKHHTYLLDGDNLRQGINSDLDFSEASRIENIRRIGEISKLFLDAGIIVLASFISPFEADREKAKKLVGEENFIEIFINCPLEICEQRDVKGLYAKAREGKIKNFTGIDSPYEIPKKPNIAIHSHLETIEESKNKIITYLQELSKINNNEES